MTDWLAETAAEAERRWRELPAWARPVRVPPLTPGTEIRWEPTEDGGFTGHMGTLEAFRIAPSGEGEKWSWHLTSALPGQSDHHGYTVNPAALKTVADKWLEASEASRPYVAAALAELRDHIREERGAQDQLAADHAELGHDDQSERAYGAVEALDRLLATMERMEAGQ